MEAGETRLAQAAIKVIMVLMIIMDTAFPYRPLLRDLRRGS